MSLNGLDGTEVIEAYQSALGEGGGWFLLRYISRDEVGILGRGNGGLGEVQEVVNAYEKQSPLLGFIQYRRRKVVLKYVPEGTSRLLQARVSVQFQSVTERLTPYDTIFAFSTPLDLHESAISSACYLHTATPSIKSSSDSLPQRNLAGITEDASECRVEDTKRRRGAVDFERGNLPHRASGDSQTRSGEVNGITNEDHTRRNLRRPRTTSNIDKALPPTPGELEHQESTPSSVLEYSDHKTKLSVEGRKSSESARSSPRDLYDAYGYKHKVKYGPRPSIESVGRPDNMDRSNDFRPVSTLPAGLRIPTRKPAPPPQTGQGLGQARPSQQTQRSLPGILTPQETLRKAPVTPRQTRNQSSSIVNNGLLTPAKTPAEPKALKSTPEKRRLMKALQLRQKQLAAQQSIGDPPAEEAHAKPQHKIPEVDESILSAILYKSNSAVDSNLVHVAVKDLSNEKYHNSEASPISIPETSEGPSTQASSITDGEDIAAQKDQEENPTEPPLLLGDADVQSDGRDEDTLRQSIVPQGSTVGEEYHASASKELHDTAEPASISSEDQGTIPRPFSEETSPAIANLPSSAEEQDLSTNLKHEQILAPETIQTMAPEITRTQHLELSAADCSHKGHETSQEVPPIESASPCGVVRLGTNAVDTHHDEEGQPRTLQEKHGSSHEAMSTPGDHVIPHEVPLPPVDEDEELSLDPQRSLVPTQIIPQQHATEGQPQSTMLQTQGHEMEATRSSTFNTASGQQAHRRIRGRGILNPPERVSSPEHSDELFLSDDSFMEELKYATVQEAKPISVSRSPIKPAFSRPESEQRLVDTKRPSRSVSSPLNSPSDNEESAFSRRPPDSSSFRSISASHSQRPEDQQVPPMPKKTGVSSGISQRIKALEQLSSRPTSPQSGASSNTSQFITLRKISVRTPPKGSNPNSKLYSKSRSQPGHPSPPPSPEAVVKSNPFSSLTKAKCPQSESISVTTTIVRDARAKSPNIPVNVSEPRVIELHQSPLVVEHQKSIPRPLSPLKPPRPRYAQCSSARSGSTSSTEQKLDTPQTARRGSFASMRSKSSRASELDMPPRSLSDSSLMSGLSSVEDIKEERKDSKRSRLMKRMSSISTMSRRSIAHALSPSPKEAPIMERQESIAEAPSTAVDVGDVNIQFPDTLLWKRRRMVVDEQGFLVLSASKSDNNSKVVTKTYPLTEFRPPYIPDQDRQELPNSVILDLKNGSTLQCACEHLQGQASVLQVLRQAHALYQSQ